MRMPRHIPTLIPVRSGRPPHSSPTIDFIAVSCMSGGDVPAAEVAVLVAGSVVDVAAAVAMRVNVSPYRGRRDKVVSLPVRFWVFMLRVDRTK